MGGGDNWAGEVGCRPQYNPEGKQMNEWGEAGGRMGGGEGGGSSLSANQNATLRVNR